MDALFSFIISLQMDFLLVISFSLMGLTVNNCILEGFSNGYSTGIRVPKPDVGDIFMSMAIRKYFLDGYRQEMLSEIIFLLVNCHVPEQGQGVTTTTY